MSPVIRKRYEVYDQVENGAATLGLIRNRFGFMGWRTIARQLRFGRFKVNAVVADSLPRLDPKADIALAER